MEIFYIIIFILFGLFTGSFLNVCIDRLVRGESIVFPPSHCDSCDHKLGFLDLIPVVSYVLLKGRCRYCRERLPIRMLIVEAVTAILFGFFYWNFGFTFEFFVFIVYGSILVIVFVIDLENQLVLDILVFPSMLIALIFSLFRPEITGLDALGSGAINQSITNATGVVTARVVISLIGGVLGLVVMSLPYLVYPSGMGMGDIKLAALVGLMTGYPLIILALLLSWISGGIIAGLLLAFKIKDRKDPIPAAVFMAVAALVTLLWGKDIWLWYF